MAHRSNISEYHWTRRVAAAMAQHEVPSGFILEDKDVSRGVRLLCANLWVMTTHVAVPRGNHASPMFLFNEVFVDTHVVYFCTCVNCLLFPQLVSWS
ncbi:hypothetical protein HanIR_Chr14g0724061 [Helianthus annuus]|nr:hypothetical protein HanIR_Chr14g0724061 [Helianthus annuus]